MSARKRKRFLDARQFGLARQHIAYSMPGWAFADEPDDLEGFLAESARVLQLIEERTKELMNRASA